MKTTTVELPRPLRAAAGHLILGPGERSLCPNHDFCCYDGTEEDRCGWCHGTYDADGFCPHMDLPPNRRSPCFCVSCKELFTGITAFDKHKRDFKCRKPERVGLVQVEQGDWVIWANPGTWSPEGN
jgi:hypothetical protein